VIDITPMIDVVFQLVLFFMVTTTFLTSPAFQVELPRADAETIQTDAKDIQVWMAADGAIEADGRAVDLGALDALFAARAAEDPDTLVVLRADAGAAHGRVVRVMDLARAHGLVRLAIATVPPEDEPR
jgi:biopolymer transport protein ExbD